MSAAIGIPSDFVMLQHAIEHEVKAKAGRWLDARTVCNSFAKVPDWSEFLRACSASQKVMVKFPTGEPVLIKYKGR